MCAGEDDVAPYADQKAGSWLNRAVKLPPPDHVPMLLTVDETAEILRTSRKSVYAMVERGLVPGVTRVGRRVFVRRDELVHWLDQKRAPSPKE